MCVPPELEQTEQVRRWTLARGEEPPRSLLSQLWPAVPSTAGDWGMGQTVPDTSRCLDSRHTQREMEKGEAETNQIIVVRYIYLPHGKYFSEI